MYVHTSYIHINDEFNTVERYMFYYVLIVPKHKRVWVRKCVGTNVCGQKRVRAQTCVGTNMSGHNRVQAQKCPGKIVWAQSCGLKYARAQTCGLRHGRSFNFE